MLILPILKSFNPDSDSYTIRKASPKAKPSFKIGSGANSYSFTDTHPANGINYYRLQSVDRDGSSSFSKVVRAEIVDNRCAIVVYPNPAKSSVTIKGNHIVSVQVIDNMGRVVKVVSLKDATNPVLSVSSLAAGVYHLMIQTTDGEVNSVGMLKE